MGRGKRMLYICYENLNDKGFIGIRKKILAQCHAFKKEFGTVYYTIFAGQVLYLLDNDTVIDKEFAVTKQRCNEIILKWLTKYNLKRTYIRYPLSDLWFVEFLKHLKEKEIKCVLEFPTIPYDNEGWIARPVEDKYYREKLYKYVDYCTTYANYETVFNIPCIPLVNGVDIEEQKEKKYREQDGTIVLLSVSSLVKWHGYERVIQGLNNYYLNGGEKTIIFNIVGEGEQLQYYKRIIREYQLEKHVFFHGRLDGQKLDALYDESDIAIGSLGFYKIDLWKNSSIKLGEYCARGIPFIYGYEDPLFSEDNYFGYQVSNDASPIDMEQIIGFYDAMYDNRNFINDMRQYALQHLTWDKILRPVMDCFI